MAEKIVESTKGTEYVTKVSIKGLNFTTESLVIAGLMRKLGVKEVRMGELDMEDTKGIVRVGW